MKKRTERAVDRQRLHEEAAAIARNVWEQAGQTVSSFLYLKNKQIACGENVRQITLAALQQIIGYIPRSGDHELQGAAVLVVPVLVDESLSTVEFIDDQGRKSALRHSRKTSGYWLTSNLPPSGTAGLTLLLGEGVATVSSCFAATGHLGLAALSSGNLLLVGQWLRGRYPDATIIILADLDKQSGEPHRNAVDAASLVDGMLAVPDFGPDRRADQKDFNDLACHIGQDAIKRCIEAAAPVDATGKSSTDDRPGDTDGQDPSRDELIARLLAAVADDCGAPFEPDNLAFLANLKVTDKAAFMRVREQIKQRNPAVKIPEMDASIADYIRRHKSTSEASSSSFSDSCPSSSASWVELVEQFQGVLLREAVLGGHRLISQSDAARRIADVLRSRYAFNNESFEWHRYDGCCWRPARHGEIDKAVMDLLVTGSGDVGFSHTFQNGVLALLQKSGWNRLPVHHDGLIPFETGLLDPKSKELHPLTPETARPWVLPYVYSPDAGCPNFLQWLNSMLEGDGDTVQLLRAWINALLTGRADLQIFLHLVGPAGTGKSTFGRLAFKLVGEENATTTSLAHLETNRFEHANIYGKRLVAIEEADKYSRSVSALKAITGQDPLRLERKNKQQSSSFIFTGQVLLMSNERLATADYTSGIERRRITVEFNKRLDLEQRSKWQERGGEEAILYPEIPGIVNWVLELTRDQVTAIFKSYPERVNQANLEAAMHNNPLLEWMLESLVPEQGEKTQIGRKLELRGVRGEIEYDHKDSWLYANYLTWCRGANRESLSQQRFVQVLMDSAALFRVELKRVRMAEGTMIIGVRFRKEYERSWLDDIQTGMKTNDSDNSLKMKKMKHMKQNSSTSQSTSRAGAHQDAEGNEAMIEVEL